MDIQGMTASDGLMSVMKICGRWITLLLPLLPSPLWFDVVILLGSYMCLRIISIRYEYLKPYNCKLFIFRIVTWI